MYMSDSLAHTQCKKFNIGSSRSIILLFGRIYSVNEWLFGSDCGNYTDHTIADSSRPLLKMAQRPSSPGPNSSASSTIDMPGMSLKRNAPHPEEWTLPHEWNIEKREMFDNWKMDVQNQISNLAVSLGGSLKKHPREDVNDFDYSHVIRQNAVQDELQLRERMAGNTLNLGLARVAVPDKY